MNKKKISALFYNNKFVFAVSVLAAVVIWLVVATEFSPEVTETIKNVPVTIDYETIYKNMGLQAYGETDFSVNVTVSGKKYLVDSDDVINKITVNANTGYITSEGTYTLALEASANDSRVGFTIDGISSNEIEVYFDYPKEKEFAIEPQIETDNDVSTEGYYIGDYVFAESSIIKVNGPESEVNKIQKIVAKGEVTGPLTQSITVDADIVAMTRDGGTPKYISYNRKSETAHITIPVYKKTILNTGVSFINRPGMYGDEIPFEVSVTPEKAEFGISESKIGDLDTFEITSIDFSQLNVGENTFTISAKDIKGGIVTDNTEEFVVTVTVDGMGSKTLPVPEKYLYVNQPESVEPESYKYNFDSITIIGPKSEIEKITSNDIILSIDLSEVTSDSESANVPVIFTSDSFWIYGEYSADVKFKE